MQQRYESIRKIQAIYTVQRSIKKPNTPQDVKANEALVCSRVPVPGSALLPCPPA